MGPSTSRSGSFLFDRPHSGTGAGTSTSGTFDASAGATLDISIIGTLTGTYTGTGGGTVQISNIGEPLIGGAGATFDFSPGLLQWNGGTIGGTGTLTNTGAMTIAGSNGAFLGVSLDNQGTIIDSETGGIGFGAVTLTNEAAAVYDIENNGGWSNGSIINDGTIEKTAGTGQFTDTETTFQNDGGTINVETGSFLFDRPHSGTGAGTSTGGTFDASPGATLDITIIGTLTGTYTGTGGGTVQISNIGEPLIGVAGATFDFSPGLLQWNGGTIGGTGTLTNTGALTIAGSNGVTLALSLDDREQSPTPTRQGSGYPPRAH